MSGLERVLRAFLYIAGIILCFYVVKWLLAMLGIHIPADILNVLFVMLIIVCMIVLVRLFWPMWQGWNMWGDKRK